MRQTLFLIILVFSSALHAVDIASCSSPEGFSYYPELGLTPNKKSGWTEDGIAGGITKLSKIGKDSYDILYVDAFKQIVSSKEDGASIHMLNRADNIVSFLVLYPGSTTEIYTFLKNDSGVLEYINVTSKVGNVLITKTTLMRGDCDYINFDNL